MFHTDHVISILCTFSHPSLASLKTAFTGRLLFTHCLIVSKFKVGTPPESLPFIFVQANCFSGFP